MQIAGLDVGTQNIKLLVAEVGKKGELRILKIFKSPSHGVRKGAIYDLDEAVAATGDMFAALKKSYRPASKNIYVSVNGPQITSHISKGIIAVSRADNEIYKDDIDRVIKASQAINLSPNRRIIHTLTREFVVDGVRDIVDPAGLVGNRLEVESVVVDAFAPYMQNLTRLVEINGCRVGGFIFGPLASARAILSKKQKELGVALVDIGAATTGLCVYEENRLMHASVFPVGALHITNDVAVGFKIPPGDAENLKLNFGYAIARHVTPKESVELRLANATVKNPIPKRFLSEIIESRLAEIFEFVNGELKSIGKLGQLPAGVVFTGGGAKLPAVIDLAREELRLSSQIGMAGAEFQIVDPNYKTELEDPEFICSLGLVLWGREFSGKESFVDIGNWSSPVASFLKSLMKSLLP